MRRSLTVALLATLSAMSPVVADLVYFARGGQAQLSATIEGEEVRLDTPDGPKVFPRGDFLGIVPEPQLRALYEWSSKTKFHASPAATSLLGEVEALSAAARRGTGPSVAVVFAAYSFEDVAAE